ncbi:NmrA/HSCARG family protein [Evansella cellulosilytica]|uniref:NmrA family protein n=1 Tax=Evansella cellulosilytica (strain ATCC 21833 / DSM 2522 / FERM P-1141 / JCM 9156 / N-4) TaxID=649639 RepID=E6TUU8_EVAC2|nr:NmrA/HSCARG family protein [Evansella cellulosilytica]ADU32100.1 NmrA family protein [Evansella cellulosilytica DSM 2522]
MATGQQGGAVTRHLLKRGWNVRAITRNPDGNAAQELQRQGVEVVSCDMEEKGQLEKAMEGTYGVFSVQNFWEKGIGYEGEVRQGKNVADVAHKVGVEHLLFSSVVDCDNASELEHWTSKWEVEKYIDSLGIPRTFLRTVFFMDNFAIPKTGKLTIPVMKGALSKSTKLHMIAVDDIGYFAAEIFDHPEQYLDQIVDIAGDALTYEEVYEQIVEVVGTKPPSFKMPYWVFKLMNAEMARQFKWNDEIGWSVNQEQVRQKHPKLKTFRTWLEENKQHLG